MQKIGLIAVKRESCTGCKACIAACPTQAITLSNGKATVDLDVCIVCRRCVPACPAGAITWIPETLHPTVLRLQRISREIRSLARAVDRVAEARQPPASGAT
jgi:Fe-S-cluster-containing hydrogenase component 2